MSSSSSLLSRVYDKSIQETEEATRWPGDSKLGCFLWSWHQILLPSPRALCCLKKKTAGAAGSEGQPSLCGLAEEEVIVQPGSGPGVSADPRLFQAGLGLIIAELKAPHRLTNNSTSPEAVDSSPQAAPCPKPHRS